MYGGKADSLIKLKGFDILVPDFFVVTVADYRQFLRENDLESIIKELLLEGKLDDIKEKILDGKIGKELEEKIISSFQDLNSTLVAVRSSAVNEDGDCKSFAGQYSSYLNVSFDKLFESIKLCWASFYNRSAVLYSEAKDIVGMNVIVQKMICADYAGVIFSVDPTSDTNHYSILEVTKGLGEELVSGKVTPTKYLIRRETNRVDLSIGDIEIDDEIIKKLENILLEIEDRYDCYVDVEYAVKDGEIYILQARPITAFSLCTKPYQLTITRPETLMEQEIYYRGEFEGIKGVTRGLYYFKPLFIYNSKHRNVDIYYNDYDLEEDPRLIYYYMDLDYDDILKYYDETIKKDVIYLQGVIHGRRDVNFQEIFESIIRIYPFISLGQLAGHYDDMSRRLKDFLIQFREDYDSIIHEACSYVILKLEKKLSDEYRRYISFITLDEILLGLPELNVLEERSQGYIYFGKLYVTKDYQEWLREHNISIHYDTDCSSLKGDVSYGGNVAGRVCIIYTEDDFSKFKKGDILVTPMTVPKFMKVIQMASGIITDEGGITCHASIVARELKIPCVVGCKRATSILKDGDLVEIDGATGNIVVK